jgi:hypothetical protein
MRLRLHPAHPSRDFRCDLRAPIPVYRDSGMVVVVQDELPVSPRIRDEVANRSVDDLVAATLARAWAEDYRSLTWLCCTAPIESAHIDTNKRLTVFRYSAIWADALSISLKTIYIQRLP